MAAKRKSKQDVSGNNKALSLRRVSVRLAMSERTAYGLVKAGEIPGFKIGGRWRFDPKVIDQWMEKEMGKNLTLGKRRSKRRKRRKRR